MRFLALPAMVAGLLLFAVPSLADPVPDAARYVSPSDMFSISAADFAAHRFHANAETANSDMVLVDFPALNSMGLPLTWRRSIEWLKLDKPVDPAQYDRQASDAVAGYLEGRFDGKIVVADRGKFRDSDGKLVYAFAAKGEVNQEPAVWQGAVLFFDGGLALVSEVSAPAADHSFDSKNGVVNQALVDWAQTLRPGR